MSLWNPKLSTISICQFKILLKQTVEFKVLNGLNVRCNLVQVMGPGEGGEQQFKERKIQSNRKAHMRRKHV